ncbi:MAG TPA: DNA recombination protein RmuC [Polyangiaceae bacterium]|nr:DNA recombination protein RmuC [Polyangiaceae bacterium]
MLTLLIGLAVGAAVAWAVMRSGARVAGAENDGLRRELEHERRSAHEKLEIVERASAEWERRFEALSARALKSNNQSFLELAQAQFAPLAKTLEAFRGQAEELERARQQAYGALLSQVQSLSVSQEKLRTETGNLVTALRTPNVRGRWGEIQLKRVVELAGMVEHCDFVEQRSERDADGRLLRPDLIVKLPGRKNVVVDSKVPLEAYLDAMRTDIDEETRKAHLARHARLVRDHMNALGAKKYWQQFAPAPDFVVMFMPDESFFRCALEADPSLIEAGVDAGVLPASPTTLITLLRTVAHTWQQETIAESARKVCDLGRELYERVGTFAKHFAKVGRNLDTAVGAYNEAVGSLEARVLVTARKLEEHGASSGDLPAVQPLDRTSRPLVTAELAVENVLELPGAAADAA